MRHLVYLLLLLSISCTKNTEIEKESSITEIGELLDGLVLDYQNQSHKIPFETYAKKVIIGNNLSLTNLNEKELKTLYQAKRNHYSFDKIQTLQYEKFSSKVSAEKELRGNINLRGTPCTDRFEKDEKDAELRSAAAAGLVGGPHGVIVGGAIYTYLINLAVDNWCDCMESTYGEGC